MPSRNWVVELGLPLSSMNLSECDDVLDALRVTNEIELELFKQGFREADGAGSGFGYRDVTWSYYLKAEAVKHHQALVEELKRRGFTDIETVKKSPEPKVYAIVWNMDMWNMDKGEVKA